MTFGIETIYLMSEWAIRLTMIVIVPFRRSPQASRSWILLIFLLPIPGVLLFAAIGRASFPAWRAERFRHVKLFYTDIISRLTSISAAADDISLSPEAILAEALGGLPAVSGNCVDLLNDYDAMIERLIIDIDGAKKHVRLMAYIFADDETGREVIEALARAVARGATCHVLLDPVGSRYWLNGTLTRLHAAGVEVRLSLPFHFFRSRTRSDMRNHRKLFIIDGTIGYGGSQNLVSKNLRPNIVNEEMVLRVTGPAVAEMTLVFLTDWFLETETMLDNNIIIPPACGSVTIQVFPSGANYSLQGFETFLVWTIHKACHRVIITTPYLIPDEILINAMRTAVLRGVVVELIVSSVVDHRLVRLAQRSYYDELLAAGVQIYRYEHQFLHAKNVSVDGILAIVGSSNIDIRSFQLNEEVNIILTDCEIVGEIVSVQLLSLMRSNKINFDDWARRPKRKALLENIARLISPLL